MSNRVELPYIAERFIGVTIPDRDCMYACSYEGMHRISFATPANIETDVSGREDLELLGTKGSVLGLHGGAPILEVGETRISYSFDTQAPAQQVKLTRGMESQLLSFETFSGDWFFATLSKCGKYLLLAEPYDIEVWRI